MQLRTRIALTVLALLAAVMTVALVAVSIANHDNAKQEVEHQLAAGGEEFSRLLDSNRGLLTIAAQAVAADYPFREAISLKNDPDTVISALENSAARAHADMAVLVGLDGKVIAASGFPANPGETLNAAHRLMSETDSGYTVMVTGDQIYQLIGVPVKSPMPVAWVVMGFKLDSAFVGKIAAITGLDVTLSVTTEEGASHEKVTTLPTLGLRPTDLKTITLRLPSDSRIAAVATLSRSFATARARFDRLTRTLYGVAVFSLLGCAAAAIWLSRNITRPLLTLTKAVDQIKEGAYNVAIPVGRKDELGVLAEGIQIMQEAVQTRDLDIRRLAYEDPLTGLMNRTAFDQALGAALTAGKQVGVAIVNLNRFRRINEHLGHSVGDAVLVNIAERLTAAPSLGSCARLSADQFALYVELDNRSGLKGLGAALCNRLAEAVLVQGRPVDINATVGLAFGPAEAHLADELISCADLALEHARRTKRAMGFYDVSMKPVSHHQLSLLGDLQNAVDRDELRLFFQPKLEIASGRVAGAEVLLRWQHPTRGLLTPGHFIPFAEQTGFIRRLTRWTLDKAVAQGALWYSQGRALSLAVNVSAEDVADLQFDQRVARALTEHQLPPSLLTLEVTESGFIDDPVRALQMLQALATLGVRLSIDDFGTGYSSLNHLARMPVHELKIDQSFVKGLESDGQFDAVVHSAIDMGHRLGLKVVAEGIETESAAAKLRKLGCDIAQGYLYARPMPLAEFEQWLTGYACIPVVAEAKSFEVSDLTDTLVILSEGGASIG